MIISTPAFVLKAYDFRETSKIAVFYTRDHGKVKGVLKGIRKDFKKFGSTLPALSLNHLVFYHKRTSEIHLVGQCDLIDDFGLYRGELKNFGFSSYAAELTDILLPLEDPNKAIFDLMFDFLNTLRTRAEDARHAFQIKVLALSGFKPHFDSCVSCSCALPREAYFSHKRGGILCARCVSYDRQSEPVLSGTIATIRYIEKAAWESCLRLHMHPSVRRQLQDLLKGFIQFHIGRVLKTDKLVREMLDAVA